MVPVDDATRQEGPGQSHFSAFSETRNFSMNVKLAATLHIAGGRSLEVHTELNQVWARTVPVVQVFSSVMGL